MAQTLVVTVIAGQLAAEAITRSGLALHSLAVEES